MIPLASPPRGAQARQRAASIERGVAASSKKFREATEADADGVVFLSRPSEHHPGLAIARPPLLLLRLRADALALRSGDARRGTTPPRRQFLERGSLTRTFLQKPPNSPA